MSREVRKLVQQITQIPGVEVVEGGKHLTVRKDGEFVTSLSRTPSDPRWRDNAVAALKRKGITPGLKLDKVVRVTQGPSVDDLRADVRGIKAGKRGSQSEFALMLMELAETLGIEGYKNHESAQMSVKAFANGGGLSGDREVLVAEGVRLWRLKHQVEEQLATPEPPQMDPLVHRPFEAISLGKVGAAGELTIKLDLATFNQLLSGLGIQLELGGEDA